MSWWICKGMYSQLFWATCIPNELLCDHMIHLRFNVEDDMKFTKAMLTRTVLKMNGKTGREANKVVLVENVLVDMYQHCYCKKGSGWWCVSFCTWPEFASGKNASFWVDTCVAKRLCGGRGDNLVIENMFVVRCDYIDAKKRICKTSKAIFDCLPCNW